MMQLRSSGRNRASVVQGKTPTSRWEMQVQGLPGALSRGPSSYGEGPLCIHVWPVLLPVQLGALTPLHTSVGLGRCPWLGEQKRAQAHTLPSREHPLRTWGAERMADVRRVGVGDIPVCAETTGRELPQVRHSSCPTRTRWRATGRLSSDAEDLPAPSGALKAAVRRTAAHVQRGRMAAARLSPRSPHP